jgi:hypothetical protein
MTAAQRIFIEKLTLHLDVFLGRIINYEMTVNRYGSLLHALHCIRL